MKRALISGWLTMVATLLILAAWSAPEMNTAGALLSTAVIVGLTGLVVGFIETDILP